MKNRNSGIIFDSNMFTSLAGVNSYEALIKQHPLFNDKRRINALRLLTEKPADQINWKHPEVAKARKELESVMLHNDKMLEKGYDPEKDAKVFKKVDQDLVFKVFRLFGYR